MEGSLFGSPGIRREGQLLGMKAQRCGLLGQCVFSSVHFTWVWEGLQGDVIGKK